MTFAVQISSDFINTVLNTGEFAETITYKPYGGSSKLINAMIFRNQMEPMEMNSRGLSKTCRVIISNDSSYGVESVNVGSDQISFPEHTGGSVIDWRVVEITKSGFGSWDLIVRK